MATTALLTAVKTALRRTADNGFDAELNTMIDACIADLGIAGVTQAEDTDPLIVQAVCTYCRAHFGTPPDYADLKNSYDEQKAQLSMSNKYTNFADYGVTSALDDSTGG